LVFNRRHDTTLHIPHLETGISIIQLASCLRGFSVSNRPNLPLAGIVVLDFGQVFQGPYATLLMAKAGADVIRIEPPHGEPLRRRAPPGKSTTFPIAILNSNKRGITLNLKHERGRALLFEMARRADVLLENFSPGTMDRPGVGWAELRRANHVSSMLPARALASAGRIVTIWQWI
jgi:hypothetical protein